MGQGRASPRAPYSPSRASPARRRPSPGLGPAGDGGGGPDTLTPTRNPPARECEGVRGSGRAAARLLPHPGRRGRVGGRAFPGLPQPPRLERPSSAFAAAAAPSWPLRGTSGFYPGKNAVSQESGCSTGRLRRSVRRARERGWAERREIITATLMELLL